MIGKSLKDRRQTKAVEELFDKADKNGNGRISVAEYAQIFGDHGIELSPEEVQKVNALCVFQEKEYRKKSSVYLMLVLIPS